MIERRIGQYEILELLGEGGVGQVYRARDTVLGRQVAIKTLRPGLSRDRDFVARFRTEALRLADLSHPNITILFQLLEEGQELFMVMELVLGREIDTLLERAHRLPLRESLAVVAQTVAGLTAAHRKGVIHRDIKPSNLKVTGSGHLKIMDFGIARVRGSQRVTRAGQMWGTLLYASPEQIRGGDVDERSDLYSLAVVFYEMLVGTPPFTAKTDHALMTAHLETPPPPLAGRVKGVDDRIEAALMRALAKQPEERFTSVEEFGRAVGASAIRGEAEDILRDFVAVTFERTAPPAPTRLIGMREEGAGKSPPDHGRDDIDPCPEPPQGRPSLPLFRHLPEAIRLPAAILGTAAAVLIIGFGSLVWSAKAIPPVAQVTIPSLPQPQRPEPPKENFNSAPRMPEALPPVKPVDPTPQPAPQPQFALPRQNQPNGGAPLAPLAPLPPPEPPTPLPQAPCGGNSDAQVVRPIVLLYDAVNRKDLDLYGQQLAPGLIYYNRSSHITQNRDQKIESKQRGFDRIDRFNLTMDRKPEIVSKTSDSADLEVRYSMTYFVHGQPLTQNGILEKYTVVCDGSGRWLINNNIDEISSAGPAHPGTK